MHRVNNNVTLYLSVFIKKDLTNIYDSDIGSKHKNFNHCSTVENLIEKFKIIEGIKWW